MNKVEDIKNNSAKVILDDLIELYLSINGEVTEEERQELEAVAKKIEIMADNLGDKCKIDIRIRIEVIKYKKDTEAKDILLSNLITNGVTIPKNSVAFTIAGRPAVSIEGERLVGQKDLFFRVIALNSKFDMKFINDKYKSKFVSQNGEDGDKFIWHADLEQLGSSPVFNVEGIENYTFS